MKPAVIAIDVRFHCVDPNRKASADESLPFEEPVYRQEMRTLCEAVTRVAQSGVPVVLSESLDDDDHEHYWAVPNRFDGFPFPPQDFGKGHLKFKDDRRRTPGIYVLEDGRHIDSLAVAAVRFRDSDAVEEFRAGDRRFSKFVPQQDVPQVEAAALLAVLPGTKEYEAILKKLSHRIIVIGGAWHIDAIGSGSLVDSHPTPVGPMQGVFVHANHIETLMDRRSLRLAGARFLEFILALAVAWILYSNVPFWSKCLLVGAGFLVPFAVSQFAFGNLGIYLDATMIGVLLLLHVLIEPKAIEIFEKVGRVALLLRQKMRPAKS